MATKDITDRQVVLAYIEARRRRDAAGEVPGMGWPYEVLAAETGQPEKVCGSAMERAYGRGLIDCGVTLRSGWVTPAGHAFLLTGDANHVPQGTERQRKGQHSHG